MTKLIVSTIKSIECFLHLIERHFLHLVLVVYFVGIIEKLRLFLSYFLIYFFTHLQPFTFLLKRAQLILVKYFLGKQILTFSADLLLGEKFGN